MEDASESSQLSQNDMTILSLAVAVSIASDRAK